MKQKKYKIGITWGSWDKLHVGHFHLLRRAKEQCKQLYVGISTDEWIKKTKGHKPMFTLEERMEALELYASRFINKLFIQDLKDNTKQDAVKSLKPDVIFVGDDHKDNDWDGSKLGIPVVYIPRTRGISSTFLRENSEKG